MLRWFCATLIACTLLLSVLLFLGWLLQNNAEKTTELVEQLSEEKEGSLKNDRFELEVENNIDAQQQVIVNNLTCVNDAQCTLVAVPELSAQCFIAINKLGAAELAKVTKNSTKLPVNARCLTLLSETKAVCRQNQCGF